jgi:antitoxin HigA-1
MATTRAYSERPCAYTVDVYTGLVTRPSRRPPTHPGDMLLKEFLRPLNLSQAEAARRLKLPLNRLNEVIKGKRGITSDTALRLSELLGTSPMLWMNLQLTWDLWHAARARTARGETGSIQPIKPQTRAGRKTAPPRIVIYREENGAFSAYVPGLPIYAAADTRAEAERAIRRLLTAYLAETP